VSPDAAKHAHAEPYENCRFRVKWDGRYVAGVSEVGALRRTTEVVEHREGGSPGSAHKVPGRTEYVPIVLRRGITKDRDFEDWANDTSLRKDVTIDLFDEAGHRVLSYVVYGCWVSEYEALPILFADDCVVAIESITLQNEGWQRDVSVP
jgi:phage tail-like protein